MSGELQLTVGRAVSYPLVSPASLLSLHLPVDYPPSPVALQLLPIQAQRAEPAGALQHSVTACITSVRQKLKPPSHLAPLDGKEPRHVWWRGGAEEVGGSGCSGPPGRAVRLPDDSYCSLGRATEEQLWRAAEPHGWKVEQGSAWKHCHLVFMVDHHSSDLKKELAKCNINALSYIIMMILLSLYKLGTWSFKVMGICQTWKV